MGVARAGVATEVAVTGVAVEGAYLADTEVAAGVGAMVEAPKAAATVAVAKAVVVRVAAELAEAESVEDKVVVLRAVMQAVEGRVAVAKGEAGMAVAAGEVRTARTARTAVESAVGMVEQQ